MAGLLCLPVTFLCMSPGTLSFSPTESALAATAALLACACRGTHMCLPGSGLWTCRPASIQPAQVNTSDLFYFSWTEAGPSLQGTHMTCLSLNSRTDSPHAPLCARARAGYSSYQGISPLNIFPYSPNPSSTLSVRGGFVNPDHFSSGNMPLVPGLHLGG